MALQQELMEMAKDTVNEFRSVMKQEDVSHVVLNYIGFLVAELEGDIFEETVRPLDQIQKQRNKLNREISTLKKSTLNN